MYLFKDGWSINSEGLKVTDDVGEELDAKWLLEVVVVSDGDVGHFIVCLVTYLLRRMDKRVKSDTDDDREGDSEERVYTPDDVDDECRCLQLS